LELRRIEETYYDEDDPDFREDVIEKRFEDTKSRLEKARQELEAARKATSDSGVSTP
jgi:DNA-binding protein YbaB